MGFARFAVLNLHFAVLNLEFATLKLKRCTCKSTQLTYCILLYPFGPFAKYDADRDDEKISATIHLKTTSSSRNSV
ncbi:hypothetical protein PF005_g20262 [Phytophthora fragariae]|uniref:Secreted protein n=1 Tax=Phytophthora fragariae TaxID=53985 RepID=A0A6A3R2Z4_9STRA|nr:hypothetical protein PF003_g12761 [Phytophthora fragariae]KAE8928641.1 hypothetical protein PF009_g21222 [Phytophthora fragariae]KAE9088540.1 hypothetical protein PF007_g19934 [Phytophthora fragariae]KAE9090731.1 hypothetical protein PF010_g18478 [Phytophthora fragariae]KAE9098773.1 hypothetical protein PF006_g23285 [Phytophthora fragariae]